jgi:hypothetical protein
VDTILGEVHVVVTCQRVVVTCQRCDGNTAGECEAPTSAGGCHRATVTAMMAFGPDRAGCRELPDLRRTGRDGGPERVDG